MKYRHAHHAGNFADVHKHITLLALLAALKRKDKGFLYLETHAGRGLYTPSSETRLGLARFEAHRPSSAELQHYAACIEAIRASVGRRDCYPGSPLLAAQELRAQDRSIFIEIDPAEARSLELSPTLDTRSRIECEDGFARLRAHLPPPERRGLTFIDPPYEETRPEFARVESAIIEALKRFATGIIAVWYPIKEQRDIDDWHARLRKSISAPRLVSEIWLYPRDSRVALNGSGMLIVNPPYQVADAMSVWLPELHAMLDPDRAGGHRVVGSGGAEP